MYIYEYRVIGLQKKDYMSKGLKIKGKAFYLVLEELVAFQAGGAGEKNITGWAQIETHK